MTHALRMCLWFVLFAASWVSQVQALQPLPFLALYRLGWGFRVEIPKLKQVGTVGKPLWLRYVSMCLKSPLINIVAKVFRKQKKRQWYHCNVSFICEYKGPLLKAFLWRPLNCFLYDRIKFRIQVREISGICLLRFGKTRKINLKINLKSNLKNNLKNKLGTLRWFPGIHLTFESRRFHPSNVRSAF